MNKLESPRPPEEDAKHRQFQEDLIVMVFRESDLPRINHWILKEADSPVGTSMVSRPRAFTEGTWTLKRFRRRLCTMAPMSVLRRGIWKTRSVKKGGRWGMLIEPAEMAWHVTGSNNALKGDPLRPNLGGRCHCAMTESRALGPEIGFSWCMPQNSSFCRMRLLRKARREMWEVEVDPPW